MTVIIIEGEHPLRASAEAVIRETYRHRYGADLGRLPPTLAASFSPDGLPASACSIRFAEHGFFSAIYLDDALPRILAHRTELAIDADDIMEVGTLAATKAGEAFTLLDFAVRFGRLQGKSVGVFTATSALRRCLTAVGKHLIDLGPADPDRLGRDAARWGRYYETRPRVCALVDGGGETLRFRRAG